MLLQRLPCLFCPAQGLPLSTGCVHPIGRDQFLWGGKRREWRMVDGLADSGWWRSCSTVFVFIVYKYTIDFSSHTFPHILPKSAVPAKRPPKRAFTSAWMRPACLSCGEGCGREIEEAFCKYRTHGLEVLAQKELSMRDEK